MALLLGAQDDSVAFLKPGFTVNSLVSYLFKKGVLRGNTSQSETYYAEPSFKPSVFREYLATDKIPDHPPSDFVVLTSNQIISQFGISEAELASFSTPTFSIEQSSAYPYIYKINNLLMKPQISNPANTFDATSGRTRVNMLACTIPFSFGNGGYRGRFMRTTEEGQLSNNGRDLILPQQLAYIYDYELGIFSAHDADNEIYSKNTLNSTRPPAVSCYVYKGKFGRLGWSLKNDAIVLDETRLLIGKSETSDASLVMDVSGSVFVDTLIVNSISTSSDIRLKENISHAPINKEILNLEPRHYNYISKPDVREYGLIAQEVEAIAPELVRDVAGYKSVVYDRLGVHLLPIVKAQEERILALENEIAEMKKAIATLLKS
jgi:hypothetical protein